MKTHNLLMVVGVVVFSVSFLVGLFFFQDTSCSCPMFPVPELSSLWNEIQYIQKEVATYCSPLAGCSMPTFPIFIDLNLVSLAIFFVGVWIKFRNKQNI